MAPRNLIGKLADNAIKSLQDPKGTAGKVVVQAKGTAALGRMVAEQVGRSAVSMAAETATSVVGKASGRKPASKQAADAPRVETPPPAATTLHSVPVVNESEHTAPVPKTAPAKKASVKKAPLSKDQVAASPAEVAAVVEAAVATDPTKTAAKKAPAQKATPGGRLPKKKAAPKKSK